MKKLIVLALLPLLIACKKNELGGDSTVMGNVLHHTKPIPFARVFIKYNASEFPGKDTNLYDAKVMADAVGHYHIPIYKGNYFLYGFGFDDDLPANVAGGIAVKLRSKEELEINVQVTEE